MVRAAERGGGAPSFASLERTLDRTIECLTSGAATREARALLVEARRLRVVVVRWRSIPPAPAAHDEMLDRVLQLSAAVGTAFTEVPGTPAPESDADGYPEISIDDVHRAGAPDDYALDFEPHLYSFEGERTARRRIVSPPASPPPVSTPGPEPSAGPRHAAPVKRQPAPVPVELDDPYETVHPEDLVMHPVAVTPIARIAPVARAVPIAPVARVAPVSRAWPPVIPAPVPVLEDEGTPLPFFTRSSPPPPPPQEDPPRTEPRLRARPVVSPSPPPSPLPPPPTPKVASPRPSAPASVPVEAALAADLGPPPAEDEPLGVPRTTVTSVAVKLSDPVDPLLVFLLEPYSPRADAYRAVRRKLSSLGNPRIIGVTSAHAREGKTTLALNLALTLRESARGRVLVIEGNLLAPGMSKLLGFPPPACFLLQLAQHLQDPRAPWVAAEPMDRLHVMAIDPTLKHQPLLDAVAFTAGMERLRQAGYDYIVVDSPPVLGSVNCNVITDCVEGMIFSALPMVSRRKEMRRAVEQIEPAACFGVVVLES